MVIKDDKGNTVILLSKRDILEYILEKCGVEVSLEVEAITEAAEECKFDKDLCMGCEELTDTQNELNEAENDLAIYETRCKDLEDELKHKNQLLEIANRRIEDLTENNNNYEKIINRLRSQMINKENKEN